MFSKTKRRLIIFLTAIAVIAFSVCCALTFGTASADGVDWDDVSATNVTQESDLSGISNVSGPTKYVLQDDISLTSCLTISADTYVYLDLNGHSLALSADKATTSVITVSGNFALADSDGTGKVTGGYAYNYNNGSITKDDLGGGVHVNGGTFTMLGGTICGNYAYNGGGVRVASNGSFTMYGGEISSNVSSNEGGGVYLGYGSDFTLNDGVITGNTAASGGGVRNGGSFVMNGGTISENTAENGGGVLLTYLMAMNGGNITGNIATSSDSTSSSKGGGIYAQDSLVVLYVYGGSITGNAVAYNENGSFGGGIYSEYANINVKGSPVISGNTIGTSNNSTSAQNIYFGVAGLSVLLDGNLEEGASLGVTAPSEGLIVKTNSNTVSGKITSDTSVTLTEKAGRGYYYGSTTGDTKSDNNVASVTVNGITYYYNSLAAAIASNLVDEYTVTIIKNVDLNGKSIAFPLGGNITLTATSSIKITNSNFNNHWFFIPRTDETYTTKVTITGAITFNGNGGSDSTASSASPYAVIYNTGNLVIGTTEDNTNPTFEYFNTTKSVVYVYFSYGYDAETYLVKTGDLKYNNSNLTVNGGSFTNNKVTGNGGVISTYSSPNLTININGGTFSGNSATKNGGAVYINQSAKINVGGGSFSNNVAVNGGAIYSDYGTTVTITGGTFTSNTSNGSSDGNGGGAIYVASKDSATSELTVSDATFTSNTATQNGGAIYVHQYGTIKISNSTFTSNKSSSNGSGGAVLVNSNTSLTVSNCKFENNEVIKNGGAISVGSSGELTVSSSTFTNNKATDNGGAIYISTNVKAYISNSTFGGIDGESNSLGNSATSGGAIYAGAGAYVEITSGTFSYNSATNGGVIYANVDTENKIGSEVSISNGTFTGNSATKNGGVVYLNSDSDAKSTLTISGGTFTGNSATENGGAVYVYRYASVTIKSATFGGDSNTNANSAGASGGAVYVDLGASENKASLEITGATFKYNTAVTSGGAVYINKWVETTISNSTFDNNSVTSTDSAYGGALYANNNVSLKISGSTFTNNSAKQGGGIYLTGATAEISDSNFKNNNAKSESTSAAAAAYGGAIYITGTDVTISNTEIAENTVTSTVNYNSEESEDYVANAYGGGIYSTSSTLVIKDGCTISGNKVTSTVSGTSGNATAYGGGIYSSASIVTITGAIISSNNITTTNSGTGKAVAYGGGIYSTNTILTVTNSTIGSSGNANTVTASITNNSNTVEATAAGGGIYVVSGTGTNVANKTLTMKNTTVEYNTVSGSHANTGKAVNTYGGGIYIAHSGANVTANITNSTISNNTLSGGTAMNGGGIYINASTSYTANVTITDTTISGNTTVINGGGVYMGNANVTLTLDSVTITDNIASYSGTGNTQGGGGVYVTAGATFIVSGDTYISGNKFNSAENNVYLSSSKSDDVSIYAHITLSELSENAHIGVTARSASSHSQITTAESGTTYYNVIGDVNCVETAALYYDNGTSGTKYYIVADSENNYLKLVSSSSVYTVIYNSNDNSNTTYTYYMLPSAVSTYHIDFDLFTRSGYIFSGYSTNSSDTGATYTSGGNNITLTPTANSSPTLYAIWKESTYSITVTVPDESLSAKWNENESGILAFTETYGYTSIDGATVKLSSSSIVIKSHTVSVDGILKISKVNNYTLTIAPVTGLDAGTYSLTVTLYTGDGATHDIAVTVTITKADNALDGTLGITGWTYYGYDSSVNSPSGVSATFGEVTYIYYSDSECSNVVEDITTAGVGTYYVKAYVAATENYSEIYSSSAVSFTISAATLTVDNVKNYTFTYGDTIEIEAITANTVDSSTATITYTYNGETVTLDSLATTLSAASETPYTISYTVTADNHTTETGSFTVTISKDTMTVTAENSSWTYGETGTITGVTGATGVNSNENVSGYSVTYTYNGTVYTLDNLVSTLVNADTYTINYTVSAPNYDSATGSFTVTISKQTVSAPEITDTSKTYTGDTFTFINDTGALYTAHGNTGTAAGTYTVTLTLNDTDNYVWATDAKTSFTFNIVKAENKLSGTPEITGWTYGNDANSPSEVTAKFGTVSYVYCDTENGTYTTTVPTAAGDYYVKAYVAGTDNYNEIYGEAVSFTIEKYEVTAPAFAVTEVEYTGNEITFVSLTGSELYTVVGSATYTNAGTYTVNIVLKDTANYVFDNGYTVKGYSFTITQKVVTEPTKDSTTYTYSGSAQTYGIKNSSDYTITNATHTDAGTYTVTVSLNDKSNYVWANGGTADKTFTFVINKGTVGIPAKDTATYTFTGNAQTYGVTSNAFYTVSGGVQTQSGTYTVTITLNDTANYAWSDGSTAAITYDWTINKAVQKVTAPAANNTVYVYNGSEQTYELATSTLYTISGNVQTNAGTYVVTVTLNDTANYTWIDGTTAALTYTFVINAATMSVTATGYSGNYDGNAHSGSVTVKENIRYTVSYGTTSGTYTTTTAPAYTEAGTYVVYYEVTADNYNSVYGSYTITITETTVAVDTNNTVSGSVTSDSGFVKDDVTIEMNVVESSNYSTTVNAITSAVVDKIAEVESAEVVTVYEITLTSNGSEVTVSEATDGGTIKVSVAIPTSLVGQSFYIAHIHNGEVIDVLTDGDYEVANGYVTFEVEHLSQFAFVAATDSDSGLSQGEIITLCVLVGGTIAVIILLAVVLSCLNKSKKNKRRWRY